MRKIIKQILKESSNLRDKLIQQINLRGLFFVLNITGLSYTKLFSMGIGPEYFTRKTKQEFIQDFFKDLGYGISLFEIDEEPIFYNENESEYREIIYIGQSKVSVQVWTKENWEAEAEFGVLYHNLSDNFIDEIFDITIHLYDNNIQL